MATTNKLFSLRSGNSGNLAISSASNAVDISSLVNKSEGTIRLVSDTDCFVRLTVGTSTAVTTDLKLVASIPEPFGYAPDITFLCAVTSGASGNLNYTLDKGV